ncbi:MAG TPA: class I SAM-dependent methyltransferase [Gammaproteobacteria bacterium]|nr:class I SAM-dependent methyltransferase [Gammaproteobacteria bacterium]
MEQQPVGPEQYNADWIASAWGARGNEELLREGPIHPRPRVARAMALCHLSPGLRLLDVACGRGEVPAIACQRGAEGIGLDYSADSITFAGRVRQVHGRSGRGAMRLVRGDATTLPFCDASFDRVTMLDIIEHLHAPQLEGMFREVRRILKPEGFAVIHTLPNRWVYEFAYPLARRLYGRIPADPRSLHERQIHVNEQDIVGLAAMLKRCGLNYRLWLEQHIPAQARWNAGIDRYRDTRDKVYPLMAGGLGHLLEALSWTPLKLLLCNDIFGILWKQDPPPSAAGPLPWALAERALIWILDRRSGNGTGIRT